MLRPFSPPPPLPPPPSLTPHRSMASTNICIHLFNSISVCGSVRKEMCREDNMSAAIITKEFHRSFRAFYPVDGAGSLGKDGPAARRTRPDREDDGPPGSSRAEAGGAGEDGPVGTSALEPGEGGSGVEARRTVRALIGAPLRLFPFSLRVITAAVITC